MIDFHTHVFWGCSHYGIEPAPLVKRLTHHIDKMRSGNAGRPVFSPSVRVHSRRCSRPLE